MREKHVSVSCIVLIYGQYSDIVDRKVTFNYEIIITLCSTFLLNVTKCQKLLENYTVQSVYFASFAELYLTWTNGGKSEDEILEKVRDEYLGNISESSCIWDTGINKKLLGHDGYQCRPESGEICKQGDIVSIFVDVDKKEISFGINENKFGVAYLIDINHKYRGGVQLEGANDEIELISYRKIAWVWTHLF